MTNEVDFAMQYSEERRRRMIAERRLFSLMYEIIPFLNTSKDLVEAIINDDADEVTENMKTITEWSVDLETQIFVTMARPPNKDFPVPENLKEAGEEKSMLAMREYIQPFNDLVQEEYQKLCEENPGLRSVDNVKQQMLTDLIMKVGAAVVRKSHEEN